MIDGLAAKMDTRLSQLLISLRFTVVSVIALGVLYPLAITGLSQLAFPAAANGSLMRVGGVIIGSEIVGQNFAGLGYFHGRPSAAGNGYDPTQTGGTNLGPTSKKLIDSIVAAEKTLRAQNPAVARLPLPIELVSSSASGIDPDISPEAALFQAPRVALARAMALSELRALIARQTTPRLLGILGEPHIKVLTLNSTLDARGRFHAQKRPEERNH